VPVTRDVGRSVAMVTSNPEMSLVLAVDLNEKKKAIVGIANGDRLRSFSEHWAKCSESQMGAVRGKSIQFGKKTHPCR
jgi:protein gp37